MASRLAADGDLGDAARFEHRRESLLEIALEHDRVALDDATAAERLLELAAPDLELARLQRELLDHGDLLAAALLALEAHHRARRPALLGHRRRRSGRERVSQFFELGERGLLRRHRFSLHSP